MLGERERDTTRLCLPAHTKGILALRQRGREGEQDQGMPFLSMKTRRLGLYRSSQHKSLRETMHQHIADCLDM